MDTSQQDPASLLDWPQLLDDMGGDQEILDEVVGLFLEFVDDQLEAVESAVKEQDAEAVCAAAHRLKGSVAQFGYEPARERAYGLEEMGRLGQLAGSREVWEELRGEVERLRLELHDHQMG